jgi:hypothetical protein
MVLDNHKELLRLEKDINTSGGNAAVLMMLRQVNKKIDRKYFQIMKLFN